MAACVFFQDWIDYMVEGANCSSDTFKVTFCAAAAAPSASGDGVIADITQCTNATSWDSVTLTTTSSSETTGTYTLIIADKTLTASADVGPLQYVVVYDDTVAADPLVCYYDYGSEITVLNTETLALNFDGTNGMIKIAPA